MTMALLRTARMALLAVLAATGAMAGARMMLLPASACDVRREAVEALRLETSYAEVKARLGCDGILVARQALGDRLLIETYRWRGDAWPFGLFEAKFYNGVMHATEQRWITLRLDAAS